MLDDTNAHWLTRRIFNDLRASDWVSLPEAGETFDSLHRYLYGVYRERQHLTVFYRSDYLVYCDGGNWQFQLVAMPLQLPLVKGNIYSPTEMTKIMLRFPHHFDFDDSAPDDIEGDFGETAFFAVKHGGDEGYVCHDPNGRWTFSLDTGGIEFASLTDAVKYKLMT